MKRLSFGRILLGGILFFWGISWLLSNLGLEDFMARLDWNIIWPVALIFIGLTLFRWEGIKGALVGSIITLTTIGLVLFLVFKGTLF